jgi:hypothetical protein
MSEDGDMSVVAFANMLNAREETPPSEAKELKAEPMTTKDYVVVLAGLVPVEVLALHAFIVDVTTDKSEDGKTTVITDPTVLKWSFWGLIVLALFLYVSVHAKNWDAWDFIRVLIPVGAFVGWTMLQPTSAFDAVVGTDFSAAARTVIAAFAAIVLGVLAKGLTAVADKKPATTAAVASD